MQPVISISSPAFSPFYIYLAVSLTYLPFRMHSLSFKLFLLTHGRAGISIYHPTGKRTVKYILLASDSSSRNACTWQTAGLPWSQHSTGFQARPASSIGGGILVASLASKEPSLEASPSLLFQYHKSAYHLPTTDYPRHLNLIVSLPHATRHLSVSN